MFLINYSPTSDQKLPSIFHIPKHLAGDLASQPSKLTNPKRASQNQNLGIFQQLSRRMTKHPDKHQCSCLGGFELCTDHSMQTTNGKHLTLYHREYLPQVAFMSDTVKL